MSAAWGGARSALRSTATRSRPLEVEAGVEGVATGVVEAERPGAEDLHHQRAGYLRAPEDEALREIQPHVLHLAGDRVRERRELNLERARDAEGAPAAVGGEFDRGELAATRTCAPGSVSASARLRERESSTRSASSTGRPRRSMTGSLTSKGSGV